MFEFDPVGLTNAREARAKHPPRWTAPHMFGPFPRVMSVANWIVKGPKAVLIYRDTYDYSYERYFERIFHLLVRWNKPAAVESWSVFRRGRDWNEVDEEDSGCILRHAFWDREADKRTVQQEMTTTTPTVAHRTYYISPRDSEALRQPFATFDSILENGIALQRRPEIDRWEWHEIALSRLFDGQGMDVFWAFNWQHQACEEAALVLASTIEAVLDKTQAQPPVVSTMTLQYQWSQHLQEKAEQ